MAIKRRKNKLQDLASQGIITNRVSGSIPFEYSGPNSPLFTISEIPDPAPQGKSSFLIAGTEFLKNGIEVKIEIIDSEGGVIYTEPVANYIEGNARRVSIEVYDDTPAGPAKLFVLAQVDPEEWEDETGVDVTNFPNPSPPKSRGLKKKRRKKRRNARKQQRGQSIVQGGNRPFFIPGFFNPPPGNDTRFRRRNRRRRQKGITSDISDQYNFLQTIEMQVVPTAVNTEKILFYQEPRIKVFEVFKPFVSNLAQTGSIALSGSLAGQVINDTQAPGATSATDTFGATLGAFRRKRKFKKFAGKGGLSKRKRITRRASPEVDNYSFTSDSFNFGSQYVGAKINLNNPQVDSNQFPTSRFSIPTTGSFEVIKVKNSSTIIPDKPFRIRDNQLGQIVDAPITHTSFSIEFAPEVTQSISITNFRSYADVRVANIRTFSGDVFRTKVYRKSEESIGDYEVFADLPLESSELLINTLEGTGLERTGYFIDQKDIEKYWEVSQSSAGVTGALSSSIMAYDIDKQMDSMYISGSTLEINQSVEVKLNKEYSFTLEEDVNYDFTAEIYGQTTPKILELETGGTETKSIAELEVYISGSNIPAQQGNEAFGAKLGVLRISENETEKDFKITTGDFESSAKSENCILILKVNSGKWYVADISIRPATETGFSPDLFTFQAPMPENEQRPETYEFIAEFYDVNNNQADAFAFTTSGSVFQGSNMVITGTDNVLESNLFIGGESTSSGMHLGGVSSVLPETGTAGAAGSGFMRSVGYTGFTSASDASLDGKPGFMIYSGSVLPDSGDNYNGVGLELIGDGGSLRFSTQPSRFEVIADAFFVGNQNLQFISGAAGNIEISSSNFHLSRTGDVTMQGTITADAGNIGGFTITSVAIASPDEALILSGSGEITGSRVLFTGGRIAGFDIEGKRFKQGNTFFIDGEPTASFFISSSNFQVTPGGDISGSQVLFTGGKIGGFELSDIAIASEDRTLILSGSGEITGSDVKFTGGTIGGWTISDTTLQGGNLILNKDGSIRSSNYVSDFSGWSISAQDNGFAEFENVKVRGTLSTTTFEKESVNAVGGQLFVANSTALTGSTVLAAHTTMSVENASGFASGEILVAKKVTNTGFTTEYIKVDSASLDGDLSKDELHGRIYVTRSISSTSTVSGSVGDPPGNAQDYEPGQVVASTGRIGTGYIRINANPNDPATPYIDIVERTGSAPYDVQLKARLGDLSGTAGSRNVPVGFTGFGLMSEVAFLSGSNIKLEAPAFILGDLNKNFVSGAASNIEISGSTFHLQRDGQLIIGDKAGNKFIEWDNSNLTVRGDLSVDNIRTPATIGGSPSTIANASSSINSDGGAFFKSGSIGGFNMNETTFFSTDGPSAGTPFFKLKSDGSNGIGEIRLTAVDIEESQGFHVKYNATGGNAGVFFHVGNTNGEGDWIRLDNRAGTAGGPYLAMSSSNFTVTEGGDVTASNAEFQGNIQADVFNFTQLVIDSSNEDEYFSNYSGSTYYGNATGRPYSKLDLSGLSGKRSKTFVRIGRRAQFPIGHIVPPRDSDDSISIFYFKFTGQTTATYQQNLVWSFSGVSGHNARVNNSSMTGTSAAREKYRATDGATGKGSIIFSDENYDKFRGIAYRKRCLVGSAHGSTNATNPVNASPPDGGGGGFGAKYEMAHQVSEDVVYTFMCKRGRWILLDISNTAVGAVQSLAFSLTDLTSDKLIQAALLKTKRIVFAQGTGDAIEEGEYATTGSTTGDPQYHLNKGGSMALAGETSFQGHDVDAFIQYNISGRTMEGSEEWVTRRATDVNDRDTLAMTKIRSLGELVNYDHTSFDYDRYVDIYQFHKEDHSTGFRWSVGHRSGSADIWIEMGGGTTTELNDGTAIPAPGTADSAPYNQGVNNIMMFPLSGSIMASGGTTSHSNLFYTRANAINVASGQSETGVTIHPIVAGIANGKGFRMIRAGSVTGMSLQLDSANNSGAAPASVAHVFVRVYKNGSSLVSGATINTINSDGDYGAQTSFHPNRYTFAAGDNLTVELRYDSDGTGETQDLEHIAIMIEIQTNPSKMNSSDVWNFDS